jgi:hypothetical protein
MRQRRFRPFKENYFLGADRIIHPRSIAGSRPGPQGSEVSGIAQDRSTSRAPHVLVANAGLADRSCR